MLEENKSIKKKTWTDIIPTQQKKKTTQLLCTYMYPMKLGHVSKAHAQFVLLNPINRGDQLILRAKYMYLLTANLWVRPSIRPEQ